MTTTIEVYGLISRSQKLGCHDVGTGGLGSIPTNPWCQRPRRSPSIYAGWHTDGKER